MYYQFVRLTLELQLLALFDKVIVINYIFRKLVQLKRKRQSNIGVKGFCLTAIKNAKEIFRFCIEQRQSYIRFGSSLFAKCQFRPIRSIMGQILPIFRRYFRFSRIQSEMFESLVANKVRNCPHFCGILTKLVQKSQNFLAFLEIFLRNCFFGNWSLY